MEVPELAPNHIVYWVCWNDLDSERGFSGKIPWSAIAHWAEVNCVLSFDGLKNVIWAMDAHYLEHIREKESKGKRNPQNQELEVLERLKMKKVRKNG